MNKLTEKRKAGPGRPKGSVNKTTALLKDAILQAAASAGGGDLAAYLEQRAIDTPGPFMALLGKVLPMQIQGGDPSQPVKHSLEVCFVSSKHE